MGNVKSRDLGLNHIYGTAEALYALSHIWLRKASWWKVNFLMRWKWACPTSVMSVPDLSSLQMGLARNTINYHPWIHTRQILVRCYATACCRLHNECY